MWFLYALSAVISTTTLALLLRKVSIRSNDTRAFSFIFNLTALFISISFVAISGVGEINLDTQSTVLLITSGLGYGIFQRYQFLARKNVEASMLQTIATPAGIIGYVLAIVWLGDPVTFTKILGYVLILSSALIVINPKLSKLKLNKYFILVILIASALSIAGTIDRRVSPNFSSALTYASVLWFFQVIAVLLPKISIFAIRKEVKLHKNIIPLLALINVVALFCTVSALQLAPVSRVTPILASNVVFISLFGIIFLRERQRVMYKFSASLIAFLGLFLISR